MKTSSTLGGTTLGLSTGGIEVNSSEKLLTSVMEEIRGMNGAGIFRLRRSSQFMEVKNLWRLTSSASRGPPPEKKSNFLSNFLLLLFDIPDRRQKFKEWLLDFECEFYFIKYFLIPKMFETLVVCAMNNSDWKYLLSRMIFH